MYGTCVRTRKTLTLRVPWWRWACSSGQGSHAANRTCKQAFSGECVPFPGGPLRSRAVLSGGARALGRPCEEGAQGLGLQVLLPLRRPHQRGWLPLHAGGTG
eukprot:13288560-Alexandrium_andersonii.AAC.1